jgi:hypothetical protein
MGKLLVHLRWKSICVFHGAFVPSMAPLFHKGFQSSELLTQNLLPQAESHLSFAGISPVKTGCKHPQMKDLNFSVSSVPRW